MVTVIGSLNRPPRYCAAEVMAAVSAVGALLKLVSKFSLIVNPLELPVGGAVVVVVEPPVLPPCLPPAPPRLGADSASPSPFTKMGCEANGPPALKPGFRLPNGLPGLP